MDWTKSLRQNFLAISTFPDSRTPVQLTVAQNSQENVKEAVMSENKEAETPDAPQVLSVKESELFELINRGLEVEKRRRWTELTAQRDAETLSEEDQGELIRLGEELESINVQRFQSIKKLATLRHVSFEAMCEELEITAQ